jgi:hypothetical protein
MALIFFGLPGAVAAASEGSVPAPTRAFTPRTAIAFYADVQSASKSAIWSAITNKAAPLFEQLQSLQRAQMTSLPTPQALAGLQGTDVAEIAIALEGEKILTDLHAERFDPNSGILAIVRLTRTADVETLIQQGLEAIEKQKPGLRGPIEKSRRRIGAAEVFDLSSEALGGHKLPFTVSVALGPGKDGTIIAVGRSENLQAFLSGKTEGKLRGQINDQLSRRGQVWLYVPVPQDLAKSMGGGSGVNDNPMFAGLAQSMDKVREVSLSLSFGSSQIDFALDFGCADGAAANQLSQGIQGLLGMIQIGAQQNQAAAPPFIGKIKAAAEGTSFRLTTAFTMRDFDLAFQNANRGAAAARSRSSPPPPKPEAAPAPSLPPVEVEFVQFSSEEQESLRPAKLRVQNRSSRPVKGLKLTFIYLDESGRKLGQWTRNHTGLTADSLVGGETTGVVDCLAFNVPDGAKKLSVTLHEVTFADGEKWTGN